MFDSIITQCNIVDGIRLTEQVVDFKRDNLSTLYPLKYKENLRVH